MSLTIGRQFHKIYINSKHWYAFPLNIFLDNITSPSIGITLDVGTA